MNASPQQHTPSQKPKPSSSKQLHKIRLHFSSQKNNPRPPRLDNNPFPSQSRNSTSKQPKDEKKTLITKPEHPLKAIRQSASTQPITKNHTALRWKINNRQDNDRKDALPEIGQFKKEKNEWLERIAFKKSAPSKSMKIQFKELLPIKQMSREDKTEHFMKIRDEFRQLVNTSNNVTVKKSEAVFRAYIEKGNNGILIKQIVKKRWWWHLQQKQPSKAHLYWSEWFNKAFTIAMPEANYNPIQLQNEYLSQQSEKETPKIQSIRMILDEPTFSRIKPRIINGNQHYLKCRTALTSKSEIEPHTNAIRQIQSPNMIHNHIDGCLQLHSKKLLFKNLYTFMTRKNWNPFEFMPVTYYLDPKDTAMLAKIMNHYDQIDSTKNQTKSHNMWIVKPGQNSNRGFGISVHAERTDLLAELQRRQDSGKCSLIVQKYIENCFLVYNRKFDIRCYILITTVNGSLKGYWYNDGYIRTSSEEYNLDDVSNRMIHLTNDAVQKHNQSYGKYEDFNKMSFTSFKKYIAKIGFAESSFDNSYEKMKKIAYYLIAAVSPKIRRRQYTFELFGLDFMLDQRLSPLLIEANSNPCLEASGVILGKLIPQLVDNVLMTAIDPLFPPPNKGKGKDYIHKDYFQSNKFQLIFADSPSQPSPPAPTEQTEINTGE